MKDIKNIGNGIIEIDGERYERTLVHTSSKGITGLFRKVTADESGEVIRLTKPYLMRKVSADEAREILLG